MVRLFDEGVSVKKGPIRASAEVCEVNEITSDEERTVVSISEAITSWRQPDSQNGTSEEKNSLPPQNSIDKFRITR
jgi:hypothetical protein